MSSLERMRTELGELADLALEVLPEMFDERTGLFSHKTLLQDGRYVNQRPSVIYSTCSLVGLLEQRRRPADDVLPLGRALDGAHSAVAASGQPRELGNLVWACVLAEDARGRDALSELTAADPAKQASAELGQAIYGLVAGARAYDEQRDSALGAARECARELLARFRPEAGVFRASPRRRGVMPRRSLLEGRFSSFAAQVYPLHGLAALHRYTGDPLPSEAVAVARRIVDAQGPLGQWWWLYSTEARKVVEGYPVYSVHQDGMAFMGLVEMERLGAGELADALALGLDWLAGANELGVSLTERDPAFISRCVMRADGEADGAYGISRANYARAVGRALLPQLGGDRTDEARGGFQILRECRSYHLGWLLVAHAQIERAAAAAEAAAPD